VAGHEAVISVCETVIGLLDRTYKADGIDPAFVFGLNVPKSSSQSPPAQPTVFLSLYRITPNGNPRIPSGRLMKDGKRQKAQLPVDLHFLLTIWSENAHTQFSVAGWIMRVMEDNPILPASLLNRDGINVFHSDETVEISLGELSIQDMAQLWESLTDNKYHLSIPYVARNVRIESMAPVEEGKPVRVREL
jgi:hypothetical protein